MASGKGGTGKTFLATNLFHALKQDGHSLTLLDCDAEEPNAALFFKGLFQSTAEVALRVPEIDMTNCTYCGKCHDYCQYHAIFILPQLHIIRVLEEFCHGCGACMYACSDGAIMEKEIIQGTVDRYALDHDSCLLVTELRPGIYSPVKVIQAGIREAANDALVIIDAPPGTACPFIQTVAGADYVILVTEPTPFGLSDLMQSVKVIRKMNKPLGVVVNRDGIGNRSVFEYLEKEDIPLLMKVPFSRTIAESYAKGELVAATDEAFSEGLCQMYHSILSSCNGNSNYQR